MTNQLLDELTFFVLAVFVGFEVISKVPTILHTPLMSGTNAIHGIILVGAILIAAGANSPVTIALGVVAAVNAVIALFYYANIPRLMWMNPVPDGDRTPIRVPATLQAALALCLLVVVVIGIYPQFFARLGDAASLHIAG